MLLMWDAAACILQAHVVCGWKRRDEGQEFFHWHHHQFQLWFLHCKGSIDNRDCSVLNLDTRPSEIYTYLQTEAEVFNHGLSFISYLDCLIVLFWDFCIATSFVLSFFFFSRVREELYVTLTRASTTIMAHISGVKAAYWSILHHYWWQWVC